MRPTLRKKTSSGPSTSLQPRASGSCWTKKASISSLPARTPSPSSSTSSAHRNCCPAKLACKTWAPSTRDSVPKSTLRPKVWFCVSVPRPSWWSSWNKCQPWWAPQPRAAPTKWTSKPNCLNMKPRWLWTTPNSPLTTLNPLWPETPSPRNRNGNYCKTGRLVQSLAEEVLKPVNCNLKSIKNYSKNPKTFYE